MPNPSSSAWHDKYLRRIPHSPDAHASPFRFDIDPNDRMIIRLVVAPVGSFDEPKQVWSSRFEVMENRDAILSQIDSGALDPIFLGRFVMLFGDDGMDRLVGRILADIRREQEEEARQANEEARLHQSVRLFTQDTKRGHTLELERDSRDKADWKVRYDRASERDRLCDWMRWQKPRFLQFLEYAAEHGDEALARLLIDEMFETERRVKNEGRGAGGMRPLRMWRGD